MRRAIAPILLILLAACVREAVSRDSPERLLESAAIQVDTGNCTGALAALRQYLSTSVRHEADAYLLAGIASKDCGDINGAASYLEQGARLFAGDAIIRYNLGKIYFLQKKYDQAEDVWKGLADSLQDPSLWHLRALNARRRGDPAEAQRLVRRAIQADERAEFYDLLGLLCRQMNDDKGAQESFKKALSLDPDDQSATFNLALLGGTGAQAAGSIERLEKELRTCPRDSCAGLSLRLSALYYHNKDVRKAISALTSLKERDTDERVYRALGMYYKEIHEWDKAIAALETAVARFVTEPQTRYDLAEMYLLAGLYSKASRAFIALAPDWPRNPWRLYYQLGYSYLEQGNLDKAQECFEKSIRAKTPNVAARSLLAFVCNRQGNAAKARELWQKSLNDDPQNPALWVNMGLSVEKDGKYEEAIGYYEKAARLQPGEKEVQINIGNLYTALNRFTDALEAYTIALSSTKREYAVYDIFLLAQRRRDRERAEKNLALLKNEFPASPYTIRAQAEMDLWNGDVSSALQRLTGLADKDADDWLALAGIHAVRNDFAKARDCLARLPRDPRLDRARTCVEAQIAYQSGDYARALSMWKATGDSSYVTRYNMALAYYRQKEYAQATAIAEKLSYLVTGKDRADVCRVAGNAAFELKDWNAALRWYAQLSIATADDALIQYNLAVASYNLGDITSAWKYYDRARTLDPKLYSKDIETRYGIDVRGSPVPLGPADSIDIWYNRAVELQHADGRDTGAERLYLQVVKGDSLNSLAWNNLGAIYGARGKIEQAENAYAKAIESRHDVPETYVNLVNLYIELEEFAKARLWLTEGLGHNPESALLVGLKAKIAEKQKAAAKTRVAGTVPHG